MTELKLCPFCGVLPEIKIEDSIEVHSRDCSHVYVVIRCPKCRIDKMGHSLIDERKAPKHFVDGINKAEAEAMREWNRRAAEQ